MRIHRILFLAACCGGLGAAAAPLESLLPGDTLGFITIASVPGAAEAVRTSAIGRLWNDPAMRLFREDFERSLTNEAVAPLELELGLRLRDWSRLIEGGLTLALTSTPADQQPQRKSSFVLLADTGSKQAAARSNLLTLHTNWTLAGREFRVLKIQDEDFTAFKVHPGEIGRILNLFLPDPDGTTPDLAPASEPPARTEWTLGLFGNILILSDSVREIEKVLAAGKNAARLPLTQTDTYTAQAGLLSNAIVGAWINLPATLSRLPQKKERPSIETGEAQGAFSLAQVLQALGFKETRSLAAAVRRSSAGTGVEVRLAMQDGKRSGLFEMLNLPAKDAGPPPFVPEDAASFTRLRLPLPRLWSQIETTLTAISPPAANFLKFVMETAGKDKDPAFDLRARLVERLGDDLISYNRYLRPGGTRSQARLANIKLVAAPNPEASAEAAAALVSLLPPEIARYRQREFLGRMIHSASTPLTLEDGSIVPGTQYYCAAGPFHVGLADDASLLEDYLRGGSPNQRPLAARPGLAEAARMVGGMSTGFFTYDNKGESMRAFFDSAQKDSLNAISILKTMRVGAKTGEEGGFLNWFDWTLLPPFERVARYFHFSVATLARDTQGYVYRWFAPAPPALRP